MLFERGTVRIAVGARIVADKQKITKRYHCRQCFHSWDFVENTIGDVPGHCSGCGSAVFDHPNPQREKISRKAPPPSSVWEGAVLGCEWDF